MTLSGRAEAIGYPLLSRVGLCNVWCHVGYASFEEGCRVHFVVAEELVIVGLRRGILYLSYWVVAIRLSSRSRNASLAIASLWRSRSWCLTMRPYVCCRPLAPCRNVLVLCALLAGPFFADGCSADARSSASFLRKACADGLVSA